MSYIMTMVQSCGDDMMQIKEIFIRNEKKASPSHVCLPTKTGTEEYATLFGSW
jgi:hypothetical protein